MTRTIVTGLWNVNRSKHYSLEGQKFDSGKKSSSIEVSDGEEFLVEPNLQIMSIGNKWKRLTVLVTVGDWN